MTPKSRISSIWFLDSFYQGIEHAIGKQQLFIYYKSQNLKFFLKENKNKKETNKKQIQHKQMQQTFT